MAFTVGGARNQNTKSRTLKEKKIFFFFFFFSNIQAVTLISDTTPVQMMDRATTFELNQQLFLTSTTTVRAFDIHKIQHIFLAVYKRPLAFYRTGFSTRVFVVFRP